MKYPINTPDIINNAISLDHPPNYSESPIALETPIVPHSPVDYDPSLYNGAISPPHQEEPCAVQPAPPHKQNMNVPYESRCMLDSENQQYDPLTRRQNADFIRGNLFSDRYKSKYQEYTVEMPTISTPENTFVVDSYFYPYPDFYYRYNKNYKTYPQDVRFLQSKPEYTYPNLVVNYPFLTSKTPTIGIIDKQNPPMIEGFNIEGGIIGKITWSKVIRGLLLALLLFLIICKLMNHEKNNGKCLMKVIIIIVIVELLDYFLFSQILI
jgi:hypothetical protein